MDVARAIAKIDPKARFRLNHSQADGLQEILEWRGPGPEPSPTDLRDAWELCLDDDLEEEKADKEHQDAADRIKADPTMSDVALVLRL